MKKLFVPSLLAFAVLAGLYGLAVLLSGNQGMEVALATDVTAGDWPVVLNSFISFGIALLTAGLIWLLREQIGKHLWIFLEKHLTWLFVITWMLGFCVYMAGMYIGAENIGCFHQILHLCCQVPMACVYAFSMFVFQSDVSAVHPEFFSNLMYMSLFSLVHFMAAVVSLLFVLKYFGYAIESKIKLLLEAHAGAEVDQMYVFWGMNNASYNLAKSIKKHYQEHPEQGTYRLLVVKTTEDEERIEANALSRMFSFVSFGKEELKQYKELDCLTENVFHRLAKVNIENDSENIDILKEMMGATSLVSLMSKTKQKVHIFFLGNDEENNIICTGNLCHDTSISAFKEVLVYCHARYDSINRVVEDRYSSENLSVKVVDSSHDSINILKSNVKYHPINFVDVDTQDNPGTVTSAFTSLVVGFGETGRDALRYLYEYGAFVDNASVKDDDSPEMNDSDRAAHRVSRSDYKCYVVDRHADQLMGQFAANAPAMRGVVAWNNDIFSQDFYKNIDSICNELNYVVIALGDDELNVTTAVRLFNYIRRHRKDLSHFAIFVRCHSDEHRKHLQNIADHYNQKQCGNAYNEHIVIFGTDAELYTYSEIVDNDFVKEGKEYNKVYCEASGEWGNEWNKRRTRLLGRRTLDALSELRRKESQDIANAYHAQTKIAVLKQVIYDNDGQAHEGFETLSKFIGKNAPELKFIERPLDSAGKRHGIIKAEVVMTDKEALLIRNLARLEHMRWNAAHELLGYQSYADGDKDCSWVEDVKDQRHGCNERFKLHNCLVDWQDLDLEMNYPQNMWHPDYKRYDFLVLTTSLLIYNKSANN